MTETPQQAYDRGTAAGEIAARLSGHDKHFTTINGSLDKVATELHRLSLAVQALGDSERRGEERYRQSWTPVQRLLAVVASAASLVTVAILVLRELGG